MTYKKYITKNGKIYGPYVYHSKRINGKVVSEYHGLKKDKKSKKLILILIGLFILLFSLIWILFFTFQITGRVVLDISENYKEGEPIRGSIKINLQEGELIPINSLIIIKNSGNSQEYLLEELVEEPQKQGNFYLEEINLSGEGKGFGKEGKIETIPEINFKFKIITEKEDSNKNETNNESIQKEATQGNLLVIEENFPLEKINSEQTIEEPNPTITGNVISESQSFFRRMFGGVTGRVIENPIKQGTISKNRDYTYNLREGQTIELIEARTENKELSLNILNYEIKDNQAIISTNYSEIINGFGKEFLGEKEFILKINFERLNTPIEEGEISIEIIYNETILINFEDVISPKSIETEIIINKTQIDFMSFALTENETQILKNKFGTSPIIMTSYQYKNKVLVSFKIGSYSAEHSYNSKLDKETISNLIERDKNLWLKDLSEKIEYQKTIPLRDKTYDKEYLIT